MVGKMRLWLNSDVGERPEALLDGSEEELIRLLDWANIACGGHAGDDASMAQVVRLCRKHGVQIGAHPSYPDRERFGRAVVDLPGQAISQFVFEQVKSLDTVARAQGEEVRHIKPHGALYNRAARDRAVALAIGEGVGRWNRKAVLVGLAGSGMLDVWREQGFAIAAEAFADRRYEPDGSLRARSFPNALITDPAEAVAQVLLVSGGRVRAWDGSEVAVSAGTICIHSDTPEALAIARAVDGVLRHA